MIFEPKLLPEGREKISSYSIEIILAFWKSPEIFCIPSLRKSGFSEGS